METTPIRRRLYPIPAAQDELGGVSRTTLYALVDEGKLQRVNIGRRSFILGDSLDSYIESLRD